MRTLLRITKTELITLFCSPIAWLILIIFTFQAGFTFSNELNELIGYQEEGYQLDGITTSLYLGFGGLFGSILNKLYLYIPLITMGLMSREFHSGSVKLAYSSPVSNLQLIIGKYFSMIVFAAILIAILLVYAGFGIIYVKEADIPYILTGLLGIFLVVCTYAAIGLFMSCLTSYQMVAAIGTLALLAFLNFVGNFGQEYDLIRELTWWLSLSGRAGIFLDGLLSSEDILYFILVILLFLTFSVIKIRSGRSSISRGMILLQYVLVFSVVLGVGYLSSRPKMQWYRDCTATRQNTLTENSLRIMDNMGGGLKITTYVNIFDKNYAVAMPARRKTDMAQFSKYVRVKPDIKMDYVYFYDDIPGIPTPRRYQEKTTEERVREMCDAMDWDFDNFLSPDEIHKLIDLSEENNRMIRLIERENGQKTFLRFYNDPRHYPGESEITAALKRLVDPVPTIAFVYGHGERDIFSTGEKDYAAFASDKTFRYALPNQGFNVTTLSLNEIDEIPQEIDILVIAEMKTALMPGEQQVLNEYISRGGNMIIAGEPRRQEIMNPITAPLGVSFMPGILVQPSNDFSADLIRGNITEEAIALYPGLERLRQRNTKIVMPGAVGLQVSEDCGFTVTPLVVSNSKGVWNELHTTDFINEIPVYQPEANEQEGSIPLMLELTRNVNNKEQRILIWGDADCVCNGELSTRRNGIRASNYNIIMESFGNLCYGEYPVNTVRPKPTDDKIYLEEYSRWWIKLLFTGILPGLLIVCSGFLLWKRKGR